MMKKQYKTTQFLRKAKRKDTIILYHTWQFKKIRLPGFAAYLWDFMEKHSWFTLDMLISQGLSYYDGVDEKVMHRDISNFLKQMLDMKFISEA